MASESVKISTEIVEKVRNHVKSTKQTIGGYVELSIEDKLNGGMVGQIKSDPELYYAWQANIAMAYLDNERWYKEKTGKRILNLKDRYTVANNAAKYFLDLLIK